MTDHHPGGKYLFGSASTGGINAVDLAENRCIPLIPDVQTATVRSASDGQAILYAIAGFADTTFYRHAWEGGKLVEHPRVDVKLPFALSIAYFGSPYDFSRDLTTIVYARRWEQADFYFYGVP